MKMARSVKKPFIGVRFACCNVYSRLYLVHNKKEYSLACPKCGRRAFFVADRNAPPDRFIEVG